MKKFEVGKTYNMTSICDHNCIWTYTVTARTAQTITITDGKNVQKCRIDKKFLNTATQKRFTRWANTLCVPV